MREINTPAKRRARARINIIRPLKRVCMGLMISDSPFGGKLFCVCRKMFDYGLIAIEIESISLFRRVGRVQGTGSFLYCKDGGYLLVATINPLRVRSVKTPDGV